LGYGNWEAFPLEDPSDVQASENLLQVEIYFQVELIGIAVIHVAKSLLRVKYYINV
jgi:hypothetical protein